MKLNFKKISAVLGTVVMAGASLGFAAAANYPQPFVTSGVANVAIVTGSGAGVSALDTTNAGAIKADLATSVTGGSTSVDGENVLLQRSSSKLHVGSDTNTVFGRAITKSDMPNLLADGTYRDANNNDHDYTQKIDIGNLGLNEFDLSQYDSSVGTSTPTIGVNVSSDNTLLNYTLTFQDAVNVSKMQYSNLNLLGTTYYVLAATATKLTLLDSSATASLSSVGDSTSLTAGNQTYTVSVSYIDSNNVKLTINGETTDSLSKGDTYKLSNGAYVGIKDILSQGYSGGASEVDFSIGSGKIELTDGSTVQVNSNSVDGVKADFSISGSDSLNSITIQWQASDNTAITQDNSLTMPTFEGAKLSFSGMTYPSNETTTVNNDGNTGVKLSTVVENGPVSFDILGLDKTTGNFTSIGKDSSHLLETNNSDVLNFNANGVNSSAIFVVSWNNSKDAKSYVYKVNNFVNDSGTIKADLVSQDGGGTTTMTNAISFTIGTGDISITPTIDYAAKTVLLTADGGSGDVSFRTLYTADGLKITLPIQSEIFNTTGAGEYDNSSYSIQFAEKNKDGDVAGGTNFQVVVGKTGDSGSYKTSVNDITGAGDYVEVGDTNVNEYDIASDLATKILHDTDPTQETATITYHGGESYGSLYLTTPSATISSGGSLGDIIVPDTQVSSVSDKNLIIVGGSCINSAAATALGVPLGTCGSAFTAQTSVGAGQFLIEGVSNAFSNGKIALVVAGYEAADTTNAATYLTHNTVDTSEKYIGTSATEATMQTMSA